MKKLMTLCSAVVLTSVMALPVAAEPSLSGNVGFVSDYYFRGANLGDGGVYAGLDFEAGGFYAGTWWIDDGTGGNDGLESDFYLGYGVETGEISAAIAYTRYEYTYTNDFEQEINVYLGWDFLSAEISFGEDDDDEAESTDYIFYSLSAGVNWFSATVGRFENDDTDEEYNYIEVSASGTVENFDMSLSVGTQFDAEDSDGDISNLDGYMVLDVSRSFDLR